MEIIAKFNSNEELLSFIGAFGANVTKKVEVVYESVSSKNAEAEKVETEREEISEEKTEVKEDTQENNDSDQENIEVTKEMVRAIFTKLIQGGKAEKAKELTAKYGANKLPELKEEHFADVYREAEALLNG